MSSSEKKVKLLSNDGKLFEVEEEVAKLSTVISTAMIAGNFEVVGTEKAVPIRNVDGSILAIVIEYYEKHASLPAKDLVAWDTVFAKRFGTDTLYDLLYATKNLDLQQLLDLLIRTVADMIKGKMSDQIRATFKIENDFSEQKLVEMDKEDD